MEIAQMCPKWTVLVFLLSLSIPSIAQDRCGTVAYENLRNQKHPRKESILEFEQWMKTKLASSRLKNMNDERTQSGTYIIPVVVHVIHNGEAVGTGANIPDNQILSQIDVINKDYNRLNADAVNTPAEFQSAAGSIDIDFVLAKQDPEGLPTNGIVRTKGTQTGWTLSDNATFKALSYWPAEDYLNIWVVRFTDPTGIIGYAQLPVSNLPGLEDAPDDRLTDGVAIDYRAFGTSDAGSFPNLYPQFNKGRTATHEIGHMLGLRHIWGDTGGCSSTDYCSDTPVQDISTTGCPSQPAQSCSHDKMFQNYMDYTNDPCMNLFTKDQIARMVVVLANSKRRASLLVSPGATDPTTVANDLGIRSIVSPAITACPTSVIPSAEVRNYGSNNVTSVKMELSVNGTVTETKDFSFNLGHLDTSIVTFSPMNLPASTTINFSFHILLTNATMDGKSVNDLLAEDVVVATRIAIPFLEQFNSLPSNWTITNPDGLVTWTIAAAPNESSSNKAIFMNFYDYENQGQIDQLTMPVFDLSTDTAAVLKFDRSYAILSSQYSDQLKVLVSTDCDFSHAVEVFNKSGAALASANGTSNSFVPKGKSDWVTETISLHAFLGQPNVQIMFVGVNDYGNNLYLDNVKIVTGDYTDLKITGMKTPSPVICTTNPTPVVTVHNDGSNAITSITLSVSVNGKTAVSQNFSGFELNTGEDRDFTLSAWTLNAGNNTVTITAADPLSPGDVNPSDNTISINEVVTTVKKAIPLRQNFEGNFSDWTSVSAGSEMKWIASSTNYGVSMAYHAFDNDSIGDQAWLVSPLLDFSKVQKASVFFDLSYAQSSGGNDRLQVVASTDCGLTFPTVLFNEVGEALAKDIPSNVPGSTNRVNTSWTPQFNFDWRKQYLNLDDLVGNSDVRLAFLVTNDKGNNLYVDNIEVFIDDDPNPIATDNLYSVYDNMQTTFKVTFNLPESEVVHLQVFTVLGQLVIDNQLPETLNQTYSVDMSGQQAGLYIVKLQMGTDTGTAKVVVPR